MAHWSLLRLYGRSRGLWLAALGVGPVLVLVCALAPRSVPLLLADTDQRLRLPAVIALGAVLVLAPSFARGLSDAEWVHRAQLRRARSAHLLIAAVLIVAVAIAVSGTPRPTHLGLEIVLNGLALLGLSLLTVALTPLPPWVLVLVLVGATYVTGSDPQDGRPYAWAWLLWTDRLPLKAAIDLALFTVGAVLFLVRPGRMGATGD